MPNVASVGKKPLRLLEKVEKPVPRPPTPTVEVPSEVLYMHKLYKPCSANHLYGYDMT